MARFLSSPIVLGPPLLRMAVFKVWQRLKSSSEIGPVQKGFALSLPSCQLCLTTAAQHDPGLVFQGFLLTAWCLGVYAGEGL